MIKQKAELINNMRKELQGLDEKAKAKIHLDSLKATLKNVPDWKTPVQGYWFKMFSSIHNEQTMEMYRFLDEKDIPDRMTKGKTTLIQNDPPHTQTKKLLPTKTDS